MNKELSNRYSDMDCKEWTCDKNLHLISTNFLILLKSETLIMKKELSELIYLYYFIWSDGFNIIHLMLTNSLFLIKMWSDGDSDTDYEEETGTSMPGSVRSVAKNPSHGKDGHKNRCVGCDRTNRLRTIRPNWSPEGEVNLG